MKKDKSFEVIVAALQTARPALDAPDASNLTRSILAGIKTTKQQPGSKARLLNITRWMSAAAAALLIVVLVYEQLSGANDKPSDIARNPYLRELAQRHGDMLKQDSLLNYYRQKERSKTAITILKEQYTHLAKNNKP